MLMGDLVHGSRGDPVISKLLQSGIEITALHNHLMRATPATFYMHIRGHGDPVSWRPPFAGLWPRARRLSGRLPRAQRKPPVRPDTDKLDQVIGAKGKVNGGVYQFSIPRRDAVTENGMPAPAAMGTGTAISFQPTGGGKAAIAGDFVVVAAWS
jgi:hypothetical protein